MSSFSQTLTDYFRTTVSDLPKSSAAAALEWRMVCYRQGAHYADLVERKFFLLKDRVVVDVAGAWGGQALAAAERGAEVLSLDLNDHRFNQLNRFCESQQLSLFSFIGSCTELPLKSDSADVIFAFELIEHVEQVEKFAAELARVIKPGGIALVTTPPRIRALLLGEPHFHLRGIALFPLKIQRLVAEKIFKKSYPYPIHHQFLRSRSVSRYFEKLGLATEIYYSGRPATKFGADSLIGRLFADLFFTAIIVKKAA